MLYIAQKTVETIIESGNDYVIAVKKNQALLYSQIEGIIRQTDPIDWDYTLEENRGRIEEREVFVYKPSGINRTTWRGVAQVLLVRRHIGQRMSFLKRMLPRFIKGKLLKICQLSKTGLWLFLDSMVSNLCKMRFIKS